MQPGLAHVGKSSFLSQFPAAGPAASWKPIRRLCHQTIQPLPFTSAPHGVIDLKICQDWIFHVDTLKQSCCRFPNKQPVKLTDRVSLALWQWPGEAIFHWKTTKKTCNVLQHHGVAFFKNRRADTPWKGELHYRASNRPPKELYQLHWHPILENLGRLLKLEKNA